jgi:DNA-binding transcriptional MocR family regulator
MHTESIQHTIQSWTPDIRGVAGPKYLSIQAALSRDIEEGVLRAGDRLPPQRELAQALGVDLTTVTRAYSEARRLGLIDADGRRGSFVRDRPSSVAVAQVAPFDTGMNLPPLPLASTLPERYAAGIQAVLGSNAAVNRLQYQPSGGAPADRRAGAEWLASRGIDASEDNVLVVSGGQTALHAIASSIFAAGDGICTGQFVYPGWLAIARRMGLRLIPVEADGEGLLPDALDRACAQGGVRAIYAVPTNDNPTTATMGESRRAALVTVARRHDLAIVEDDAYGPLREAPPTPLAALAPERTWHVASFSKIVSPAMRVAYLRAPTLRDAWRLAADVHETTVMAPPLNIALASQWLGDGTWAELVCEVRTECIARQTIAGEVLRPGSFRADREGYHLWVPTGPDLAPSELVSALQPTGLSAVPSEAFAANRSTEGRAAGAIRVSIGGGQDREQLRRALSTLDALLHHRGSRGNPMV